MAGRVGDRSVFNIFHLIGLVLYNSLHLFLLFIFSSPIIGAGTYANKQVAVSCTGHGELFIQYTSLTDKFDKFITLFFSIECLMIF